MIPSVKEILIVLKVVSCGAVRETVEVKSVGSRKLKDGDVDFDWLFVRKVYF